jgi:CelD/BcsL family acetyltransferase involved in cellulose biosynthesis
MVRKEAGMLGDRPKATAMPVDNQVAVEVLRGRDGIESIAGEWQALHARAGSPEQVFLSHAWIALWRDHYLPSSENSAVDPLVLIACRQDGQLSLVWPLVEVRRFGLRLLKWAGEPVSQYGDVLMVPGDPGAVLVEAAWQAIQSLGIDALVLRKTRAGSTASAFLKSKGAFVSEQDSAPFIDLAGVDCPIEQAGRYSAKDRKNRRRHRKRMSEIGELRFEWLKPSAEASRLASAAVVLKRGWLTRRGRISKAFTDNRIDGFLSAALSGRDPGLDGRVGVINCCGKPAALLVGFLNQGYYAGFLTAYDSIFERNSPGSLLFEDAIQAAIAERFTRIDLLAPADTYKQDWASGAVTVEDLCLPLTVGGNIYTRVVQSRVRHGIKAGIESLPPAVRRAVLHAAMILPALIYASSEP